MSANAHGVTGSPASAAASALLAACVAEGLTDVVVSPGARSQALALAAWHLEQRGKLTLHVRIDERSAAFFALGLARETGRPAAVITTSGTAVANLTPAVLEAHHAAIPLLLLTGDRPEELRGIRSNQTTVQSGMFSGFVRYEADLAAPEPNADHARDAAQLARRAWMEATGAAGNAGVPHPGPVHLNLALRTPLSDEHVQWDALEAEITEARSAAVTAASGPDTIGSAAVDGSAQQRTRVLDEFVPTVVIAGSGAGSQAETFAHDAQLPLLAEVVSGARFGREAITHYRELLRGELGAEVERVIVFGVPTLTRDVPTLIQRDGVETIVIDSGGDTYNPGHRVSQVVDAVTLGDTYDAQQARAWLGAWVVRDRELIAELTTVHEPNLEAAVQTGYKERSAYAKTELAAMREPITRAMLAESVWRATWPHDRLVVGASHLIRVLDAIAQPRNVRVISNRGLAGIDGTISTAAGVAVASQHGGNVGVTRVLLGDVTALHDVGGFFWGAGEPQPRLQLIIGNDGGGSIFDSLEVAGTAQPDAFDRVMFTPHQVSFDQLAAAYGWNFQRVSTRSELEGVFTTPVEGLSVVEVTLARHETREVVSVNGDDD